MITIAQMLLGFRVLEMALGLFGAPEAVSASASPSEVQAAPQSIADQEITNRARRHFRSGLKLYRDTNYAGALAEFEAAYQSKPGAGSLQNVALCLKALFRYAEAASTLNLLLERHSNELSPAEQESVRRTVDELYTLVGTLFVSVEPEAAELVIDGRAVTREERGRGIRLNVGEHTLIAEARGHAPKAEVVRIAGQQQLRLQLALKPSAGFLEIVSNDPKAAIALDDEPLAYHRWSGPVSPGVDHVVQVYRDGFEPFERTVRVELGKTLRVEGRIGPAEGGGARPDDLTPLPQKPAAPPPVRGPIGFYGTVAMSVVGLTDTPLGFRVEGTDANLAVPSFGLRGGYRLSESLAVEALFDIAQLNATEVCQPTQEASEVGCAAHRDFSLRSLRFGPNLRLMTHGETIRFVTGVGAGIVSHRLVLEPEPESDSLQGGEASGFDPYFSLELGVAYNFRHFLAEVGVIALIEGTGGLQGEFAEPTQETVFENGTLPMLGFVLKLGYSAWSPRR